MMNVIIGADMVPTKSNVDLFIKGDIGELLGTDLSNVLKSADFRIFNLETPLCDEIAPIDKCGPALIAPSDSVNLYEKLNVNLLTLANNHIMDQGTQGFESTRKVLREKGIDFVGVGENLKEASETYHFNLNGKRFGIYACAEHEFSIAETDTCGANPFDALESFDHVVALKQSCDYVIVLYHGGKEHYRYPSPNLQKICRKFVEKGADLVVCQHSHCIGCKEEYLDSTIVYGQGNFIFDHSESEYWQTSLLIRINEDFSISYIPIVKQGRVVRLAKDAQASEILTSFQKRSDEILRDGFIEENYKKFARESLSNYLFATSGIKRTFFLRALNKLSGHKLIEWILRKRYKKRTLLAIRNYVECEAHRELFLRGLIDE